jgi:hypothetical protein
MLVHKFHFTMSGQHLSESLKCGSWTEPGSGHQKARVLVSTPSDFYKLQTDGHGPGASTE